MDTLIQPYKKTSMETGFDKAQLSVNVTGELNLEIRDELAELIVLKDLWPASNVTSQQLTVYRMILSYVKVTREERRQALQALSLTSSFFPSVKEIYDMVLLIREKKGQKPRQLTADEAWKCIVAQINDPKEHFYPNPEAEKAIKTMGGWRIFDGDDPLQILYAHFRDTYDIIVAENRTKSVLDLILQEECKHD